MNQFLSSQQIGQRIARLRKQRGFSQEELAREMKISRPSLAQIERGNRNLTVVELQTLSLILRFSLDEFVAEESNTATENILQEPVAAYAVKERVSTPQLNEVKFKNVLLYLLERCAGKPNVDETVLARLLYFCDFNHYEMYEEQLTGATYRKVPYGPVPEEMDTIIGQMVAAAQIQKLKTTYQGRTQTRYIPLEKADLTTLKASEADIIDKIILQMGDWPIHRIHDYLQADKPWKASTDYEVIDYELVFYRKPPYAVRTYSEENEQDII
ncbi:MAG: DUF4065 domain-containing protein [Bacteroidia bacterium]